MIISLCWLPALPLILFQPHTHTHWLSHFALLNRELISQSRGLTVQYIYSCYTLVWGFKNSLGWCQSSGEIKLIWNSDLKIFVLNHINSDIIEPRVEMELHHPSSHRVICTPFPEHLITLSHLEFSPKLNNSVPLHGMFQRSGKPFSIFNLQFSSLSFLQLTLGGMDVEFSM